MNEVKITGPFTFLCSYLWFHLMSGDCQSFCISICVHRLPQDLRKIRENTFALYILYIARTHVQVKQRGVGGCNGVIFK